MADIKTYREQIENKDNGGKEVRKPIIEALKLCNTTAPNAITFNGLTADGYARKNDVFIYINALIDKVKKSNVPKPTIDLTKTKTIKHDTVEQKNGNISVDTTELLTTKGLRVYTGRLDQYPT